MLFPAEILLRVLTGNTSQSKHTYFIRRSLFWLYILLLLFWFLLFSINTFYQSTLYHAEAQAKGGHDTGVIIIILDDISWVSVLMRNILILSTFVFCSDHFSKITKEYDSLCRLVLRKNHKAQRRKTRSHALNLFLMSFVAVVLSSVLYITYWNHMDYSEFFLPFSFLPFPFSVPYWVASIFMVLFGCIPFILAQAVLMTFIGIGAGVLDLMTFVNEELNSLTEVHEHRDRADVGSLANDTSASGEDTEKSLLTLRYSHFRICTFISDFSESSCVLFMALLFDAACALGFVGLLIGYKTDGKIYPAFDRVYQSSCLGLWLVYFLCGSYWPFIRLHEECDKTYDTVMALSLKEGSRSYQREVSHFLVVTKNTAIGVVAGRVFMFSRHLFATIMGMLCSFGLLMYEMLHINQSASALRTSVLETILPESSRANLTFQFPR